MSTLKQLGHVFTGSWLNVLLIVAPISWYLAYTGNTSLWVFVSAAVCLIPAAGLIGEATEELANRSGPTLGGFLNATFGNAAELIIAFVALRAHHVEVVKASITGSIVGNLLLFVVVATTWRGHPGGDEAHLVGYEHTTHIRPHSKESICRRVNSPCALSQC